MSTPSLPLELRSHSMSHVAQVVDYPLPLGQTLCEPVTAWAGESLFAVPIVSPQDMCVGYYQGHSRNMGSIGYNVVQDPRERLGKG